jgi:hypothetical protein
MSHPRETKIQAGNKHLLPERFTVTVSHRGGKEFNPSTGSWGFW